MDLFLGFVCETKSNGSEAKCKTTCRKSIERYFVSLPSTNSQVRKTNCLQFSSSGDAECLTFPNPISACVDVSLGEEL
jgi:hypothetical protein